MTNVLKEGDIVEVPYGMRIIYPQKRQQSWLNRYQEKRKKHKDDDVEVEDDEAGDYGGDEGDRADDDDGGNVGGGDEGDGEGGDDYGDGGDQDEVDGGDDGGDDDADEIDGDGEIIPESYRDKARYEVQPDWVYKKVPIYTTTSAEALAESLGIPLHHEKLVKINVRRKIEDVQITHAGLQRMRVGKNGRLTTLIGEKRAVVMFDDDAILQRPQTPAAFKPRDVKWIHNPYNDDYSFGTYVKFKRDGVDREGIVMTYNEKSVGISQKLPREHDGMIFVDYQDPTLIKAVPPKKETDLIKKVITADDVYASDTILPEIRKMVIDTYTTILDELRTKNKNLVAPVTPSSVKAKLKDIMFQTRPRQILDWNDYYAKEFFNWVIDKYHHRFVDMVDRQSVARQAGLIVKEEMDSDKLLLEITDHLPNKRLSYETTLSDIITVFRKIKDITIFQATCIQALEKEKYRGGDEMKGAELATFLSTIVQTYYRMHPPDMDKYYKQIFDMELQMHRNEYNPTQEDKLEFEGLYLETIKTAHQKISDQYEREKIKYNESVAEEKNRAPEGSLFTKIMNVKITSPFRNDNVEQVKRFEQLVYVLYGSTVHSYLSAALMPHIFLEGPLARISNFFRAKVANGSFVFSALVGANIAHYLPEVAMNKNLTDDHWERLGDDIGVILHNDISTVIDTYVNIIDFSSTVKHTGMGYETVLNIVDYLKTLVVDPAIECLQDTSTGIRRVITDGRYVTDPKTKTLLTERIPDGDLAICFNPESKTFTCHSMRDVMLSIQRGDLKNPHTQQQYPTDFIERIKSRNSIIKLIPEPKSPLPVPSPRQEIIPSNRAEEKPKKVPSPTIFKKRKPHNRYIAPKKGKYESVTGILLYGDSERLALFADSFTFKTKEGDQEIPITYDRNDKTTNVVVITFYADQPSSFRELSHQIKKIPAKRITNIYVAGLDAKGVTPVARTMLKAKFSKLMPYVKDVFYAEGHEEEDIRNILIDVAVSVEGINAAE